MNRRTWLLGALCTGVIATGCGSDDPKEIDLQSLPPLFAESICDAYIRCLGPATPKFMTYEMCVSTNTAQIEDGDFRHVQGAVNAGRVHYDGTRAQACLTAIAAAPCDELGSGHLPDACDAAVEGSLDIGADCAIDEECAGDAYCKLEAACPGTCTAVSIAGGPCNEDEHCTPGLVCGAQGTCTVQARLNQTCGGDAPDCALGLLCAGADDDQDISGTCRTIDSVFAGTVGATCSIDDGSFCQNQLSCAATVTLNTDAPPTVAWACEAEAAEGAACKLAIPDQCPGTQYCDVNPGVAARFESTCKPLPRGGQPCTEWQRACAPGNVCDTAGTCRPVNRIGGACTQDSQCASGYCNGTVCAAPELCEL